MTLRCWVLLAACYVPVLHGVFSGVEPMFDKGEAFSGAWLAQTSLLIESPKVRKYMTQLSNPKERMMCESASFMLFQRQGNKEADIERWGGPPGQTVDLFDFSVLHLSSAERLFNKAQRHRVAEEVPALHLAPRLACDPPIHPPSVACTARQVHAILDSLDDFYCPSEACGASVRRLAEVAAVDVPRPSPPPGGKGKRKRRGRAGGGGGSAAAAAAAGNGGDGGSGRRRLGVTMARTQPDSKKDFGMVFNQSSHGGGAGGGTSYTQRVADSHDMQAAELRLLKH